MTHTTVQKASSSSSLPTPRIQLYVTRSLGFLGLIPFFASLYWVITQQTPLDYNPAFLFLSYSAIILSFLAGTLWGRSIQLDQTPTGSLLLIISNGAAIVAWCSLLLGFEFYVATLILLMAGFSALLAIEYRGYDTYFEGTEPYYMQMRFTLTTIVLITHIALLAIILIR